MRHPELEGAAAASAEERKAIQLKVSSRKNQADRISCTLYLIPRIDLRRVLSGVRSGAPARPED